jgi:hypothetical protein
MAVNVDALVEKFAADATKISAVADARVEKILEAMIKKAKGLPIARGRVLRDQALAKIETILNEMYGTGSEFEKITKKYLSESGLVGRDRIVADAAKIGYSASFKIGSVDAASILTASRDTYALAARNLTTQAVEELRQSITEEMIRGGGEKAIRERLVKSGYIKDLKIGKRVLRGETRASMMARTEPHRIANASYAEQARKVEPVKAKRYYKWISALGPKVGDDSLRRHGLILSEEEWENTDFGDGMYGRPPIRPNDNCIDIFYPKRAIPKDLAKVIDDNPPGEGRRTVGPGDGPDWSKLYDEKVLKKKA